MMEFTDLVSYIKSNLEDYYSDAKMCPPEVECEVDETDVLINIRLYTCMVCPSDLEYFNSLVGKEYHHITFEYLSDFYFDEACLIVVYKF